MAPDDILGYAVVIALVIIPALAFTARFALKPMVESMLRLRESLERERSAPDDRRLLALEDRLAGMEARLERIADAVEFDARLRGGRSPAPVLPAAPPPAPRAATPTTAPARPRLVLDRADYEQEYE